MREKEIQTGEQIYFERKRKLCEMLRLGQRGGKQFWEVLDELGKKSSSGSKLESNYWRSSAGKGVINGVLGVMKRERERDRERESERERDSLWIQSICACAGIREFSVSCCSSC
jgi:hypothetical protein